MKEIILSNGLVIKLNSDECKTAEEMMVALEDYAKGKRHMELQRLMERFEWHPIEVAPRNGTVVLGYNEKRKNFYLVKWGKWDKKDAWICNSKGSKIKVTHWMPIPEFKL
jgi:hypothetical protein